VRACVRACVCLRILHRMPWLTPLQVNNAAQQAVPVTTSVQPLSDAIAAGAVAMFRCL